jgi:L-ribulose-5-phosphate 3-epimerase UlaE
VSLKNNLQTEDLIRSPVSDFFCYKQKVTYKQLFVITQQIFFNFILLSLMENFKNINPVKVDKSTIISLEKEITTTSYRARRGSIRCHDD